MQHFLVLLILVLSSSVYAQDERYFRHILSGELPNMAGEILNVPEHQFNVSGSVYHLDLNGDGIEELIVPEKRDGVDWILITNSSKTKIFEGRLLAMGGESHIYKIKFAHLSPTIKALVIFLDEGRTTGRRFESTARIYVLSFENNDFSTIKFVQGPHHFHEKESQREQYYRRDLSVEIRDVDQNGVRDVVVQYHHIQRILRYTNNGWERL